jgi:membrane protease YdiL (CAAX protease family)
MRWATSALFLCTILWSASGAMAEDAVIAAPTDGPPVNQANEPASAAQGLILLAWLLVSVVLVWQRRWWRGAMPVRWNLNLLEDQILIACGVLLSGMVASITAAMLGADRGSDPSPAISLAALTSSSAVTLGVWMLLTRHARELGGRAGPDTPEPSHARAAIAGIVGIALAWPVVALASRLGEFVQQWMGGPPVPIVAHATLEQLRTHASDPFAWLLAIAVVTLTPVTEEVLWRGAVQQGLKSAGLPRPLALIAASGLFALVHWSAVPSDARAGALPALFVLGLLFGWLFERTGRLLASITAHAAFNAANLLLFSTLPG